MFNTLQIRNEIIKKENIPCLICKKKQSIEINPIIHNILKKYNNGVKLLYLLLDIKKYALNPESGLAIGPDILVGTRDGELTPTSPEGYGDVNDYTTFGEGESIRVNNKNLRYKVDIKGIKRLIGLKILSIQRRSKYLLFFFEKKNTLFGLSFLLQR